MIGEMNDQVLEQLPTIIEDEGITSFKVFMAYKDVFQADDATLYQTLIQAKELGALVMVHAENGDVIDYLTKKALEAGSTDQFTMRVQDLQRLKVRQQVEQLVLQVLLIHSYM